MIPAAAVEAAWLAFWGNPPIINPGQSDMRAALEAAAPHLTQAAQAEAWDDGHRMGWDDATANTLPERDSLWRNPYRTTK